MKRSLIIIIAAVMFGMGLPVLTFAQTEPISPPGTLEEAKEMVERGLERTVRELPGILRKMWEEEVLPVWQRMYDWFYSNIWLRIKGWFEEEVEPRVKEKIEEKIEERKEIIKEGLEKEKEELKEELRGFIPQTLRSLWERFQELIRRPE